MLRKAAVLGGNMCDAYLRLLHDLRVPTSDQLRLTYLIARSANARSEGRLADVALINKEICDSCHELLIYLAAIESWENEGGQYIAGKSWHLGIALANRPKACL
jgi:hypothetical protein